MKDLIKEVLSSRDSRTSNFLAVFVAVTFTAGHPWG